MVHTYCRHQRVVVVGGGGAAAVGAVGAVDGSSSSEQAICSPDQHSGRGHKAATKEAQAGRVRVDGDRELSRSKINGQTDVVPKTADVEIFQKRCLLHACTNIQLDHNACVGHAVAQLQSNKRVALAFEIEENAVPLAGAEAKGDVKSTVGECRCWYLQT